MPYKVIKQDSAVGVLKKVGEATNAAGTFTMDEHETIFYMPDAIIPDADVAPTVVSLYDAGDPHIRSMLVRVDDAGNAADEVPAAPEAKAEKVVPVSDNLTEEGVIKAETGKSQMARKAAAPAVEASE